MNIQPIKTSFVMQKSQNKNIINTSNSKLEKYSNNSINSFSPMYYSPLNFKGLSSIVSKKVVPESTKYQNLLDLFIDLVKIPSPSNYEDDVAKWIYSYCAKNSIPAEFDKKGNIIAKIKATDPSKKPLLLSAHMDVVGGFEEVKPLIDGDFIQTDGARTLGADDKAGIASALQFAKELQNGGNNIKHGGLEILLTKDEELRMSGLKESETEKLESKYALVLDTDTYNSMKVSSSSYIFGFLDVKTLKGGHSGFDINDPSRKNAANLIAELIKKLPNGVFYKNHKKGVITSSNLGSIVAGDGVHQAVATTMKENAKSDNYAQNITDLAATNIINKNAKACYSIRSLDLKKQNKLLKLFESKIKKFNKKYKGIAEANMKFIEDLPIFEESKDKFIPDIYKKVCAKVGLKPDIGSTCAGAETNIYPIKKNKNGENFIPYLLGTVDIEGMHTSKERMNYQSFFKGYELLKEMFLEFNK